MSSYRRRLLLANQSENLILYGNSVQDGTPTPEAPIDIMSVENPTIKVNGNNLFNNDTSLIEQIFYTSTSGTQTSRYGYIVNLPVGTYTVTSFSKVPPSDTHLYYIYVAIIDENNVVQKGTGQVVVNSTPSTFIFTIKKGQRYFIYDAETAGLTHAKKVFSLYDIQLAKGESVKKYEPYEEELITIDETTPFGKNLIPYPPYNRNSVYVDNKNGTYGVNGTLKTGVYYGVNIIKTNLGDYLEHGKYYTMSLEGLNIPDGFKSIGLYIQCLNKETSANAWPHQCNLTSNGFTKSTFYVDKDKYDYQELFIQIDPAKADLTVSDMLVIPMLNEGKEALPFEPYIPPITTMRGIGEHKDKIYTKEGKVWFEQNIKYYNPTSFLSNSTKESAILNWWKEDEKNYPLCTVTDWPYVHQAEQMSNIGAYSVDYKKTGKLHWYTSKIASHLIPPDEETWTNATDAYEYFMSVTGNIPMEYQYVLATPIITEITGALAEKILAIDKSKNITIYSDNGVYGETVKE